MEDKKYIASVQYGRLKLSDSVKLALASDVMLFDGKEVELILKPISSRSKAQVLYFFGVVIPEIHSYLNFIGNDCTIEDVQVFLKNKFNYIEMLDAEGLILGTYHKSTKLGDKDAFGNYIDLVVDYAVNVLKIRIPEPEIF